MSNWSDGLSAVADVQVMIMLVLGVLIGMVVGALPGISATVGVALLLPFTFALEPLAGMMLLLGIYGGAVYAGSIPAILIRTPAPRRRRRPSPTATPWRRPVKVSRH
jgi:putative tricarboxylic transport membrane protein